MCTIYKKKKLTMIETGTELETFLLDAVADDSTVSIMCCFPADICTHASYRDVSLCCLTPMWARKECKYDQSAIGQKPCSVWILVKHLKIAL